jgi:Txe/YoeB family toxin of Txe-Axe toxin-antitoxin module
VALINVGFIGTSPRFVYQILDEIKTVKVIRMWTHYE